MILANYTLTEVLYSIHTWEISNASHQTQSTFGWRLVDQFGVTEGQLNRFQAQSQTIQSRVIEFSKLKKSRRKQNCVVAHPPLTLPRDQP